MFNKIKQKIHSNNSKNNGSIMNIIGLVTGMVIFAFSFAFVHYEKTYDKFFSNYENIVMPYIGIAESSPFNMKQFYATFYGMRLSAKNELDEVVSASHIAEANSLVRIGENFFHKDLRFVNPDFFDIFNLDFIEGGSNDFSTRSDVILLSEQEALTLFGRTDIVGETILLDNKKLLEIRGVYKNLPLNSHLTSNRNGKKSFDLVSSIKVFEEIIDQELDTNWDSISSDIQTYYLLKPGTDISLLEKDLTGLLLTHIDEDSKKHFDRSPVQNLSARNMNGWERGGVPAMSIALGIGVLILSIAVLNAISLNTARLMSRNREIGMRRVVGASKWNIINLFLKESMVTTFIALGIALIALFLLLPIISQLTDRTFSFSLMFTPTLLAYLVLVSIFVSVLNVSYPAVLLMIIGNKMSLGRTLQFGHSGAFLRKTLATVQFAITTALIFSVVVVDKQNNYMLEKAPEFLTDQIVVLSGLGDEDSQEKLEVLKTSLAQMPGVEMVSMSSKTPFSDDTNVGGFKLALEDEDNMMFEVITVGDQFLPLYEIPLIAGRNFDNNRSDDMVTREEIEEGNVNAINVIINETGMKKLGITNPVDAIGKQFYRNFGDNSHTATIIGVMPDIKIGDQSQDLMPTVLLGEMRRVTSLSIRYYNAADIDLGMIESTWKTLLPTAPISVSTLSEALEVSQKPFHTIRDAFITISIIAIILAATGLYSLSSYLALSSKKEMSIRRVVGAKTYQLIRAMLLKFSKPLGLALIVGLPMGELSMGYYLNQFSDRVTLSLGEFVFTGLTTLLIAYITVFSHSWRVAKTSPAEVLRAE